MFTLGSVKKGDQSSKKICFLEKKKPKNSKMSNCHPSSPFFVDNQCRQKGANPDRNDNVNYDNDYYRISIDLTGDSNRYG